MWHRRCPIMTIPFLGSELLLRLLKTPQRVNLIELRPGVAQGIEQRLSDHFAQAARQREVTPARKVVEVLPIILVCLPQDIPRRETSAEGRPGYSHATEYEAHVRVLGRPRNDRQQVPGHIDLPRPELNEGEIAQLREMTPDRKSVV